MLPKRTIGARFPQFWALQSPCSLQRTSALMAPVMTFSNGALEHTQAC